MGDSVTSDQNMLEASLRNLPTEILWCIFTHSNIESLMPLSRVCRILRYHIHEYFASCIYAQAEAHLEVKQSLDRIGWKKKHNFWNCCYCFKMMGGPISTWSELREDWRYSSSNIFHYSTTVATVDEKIICMTHDREFIYIQIASEKGLGQKMLKTPIPPQYNLVRDIHFASYDTVVAVGYSWNSDICLFNMNTLTKIAEVENSCCVPTNGRVLNTGIALSQNTMIICINCFVGIDAKTKIQIWSLNTHNPQDDNIVKIYTISNSTATISKHLPFLSNDTMCVNNEFLVIYDVNIKVFKRELLQYSIVMEIDIGNYILKDITLQSEKGDHLAVAVLNLNYDKIIVKVCNIIQREWIFQKQLHLSGCPSTFYMKWFGYHLIIGYQHNDEFHFFSWQPELSGFISYTYQVPLVRQSPRRHPKDMTMWTAGCLYLDFEGIIASIYGQTQTVHIKNWKSVSLKWC